MVRSMIVQGVGMVIHLTMDQHIFIGGGISMYQLVSCSPGLCPSSILLTEDHRPDKEVRFNYPLVN